MNWIGSGMELPLAAFVFLKEMKPVRHCMQVSKIRARFKLRTSPV
jgi:hypothetical protein